MDFLFLLKKKLLFLLGEKNKTGIFQLPLINTYLRIEINQIPKLDKLKKELSDFFDKNEIEGVKIKSFEIDKNNIIPNLEGRKLIGTEDYSNEISAIGKRYRIDNLQLSLSCYAK